MKKVAILESLGISGAELEAYMSRFAGKVQFDLYERTTDPELLLQECRDKDAVILPTCRFRRR